ncbi:MAG: aromatic amino acid transport family protein [Sporomusa sp.]
MKNNLNEAEKIPLNFKTVPFTKYDFGWVLLCLGMAIGAGIVFLPVQVGLKGIWVFTFSVILTYPAIYLLQTLYLKTLSESETCEDYTSVITQYLGHNWGVFLGIAYFLMLLKGMLTYSLAVTFDSASYLQTFGLTTTLLSNYFWYGLVVLILMVSIAAQGERLLFKVAGPMVVFKLCVVVLLGVIMVPYWDIKNIAPFPEVIPFLRDTLLTLPFTLFSILFVQILSPMNVAYHKIEADKRIANYKIMRVQRISYTILAVGVLFFAYSFALTLSHEAAVSASKQNISALALSAQIIPSDTVKTLSTLLNIFAILSAFFGIFLGFQEAIKGIALNIITRIIPKDKVNKKMLNIGTCVFIVLLLWGWVMTRFSILLLQQIGSPVYGIVACIIPCYLVYKVPVLNKFKGPGVTFVIIIGIMLCMSPLFKLFE